MNQLGCALSEFKLTLQNSALDAAIEAHKKALDQLRDDSQRHRATCLNDLGFALQLRYESRSLVEDLDSAITIYQ
jgi:hypothetical protein